MLVVYVNVAIQNGADVTPNKVCSELYGGEQVYHIWDVTSLRGTCTRWITKMIFGKTVRKVQRFHLFSHFVFWIMIHSKLVDILQHSKNKSVPHNSERVRKMLYVVLLIEITSKVHDKEYY